MDFRCGGTGVARGHVEAPNPMPISVNSPRSMRLIYFLCKDPNGCDHTSTNTPDPIRPLQSSVL